jgi:hypothetical protein
MAVELVCVDEDLAVGGGKSIVDFVAECKER